MELLFAVVCLTPSEDMTMQLSTESRTKKHERVLAFSFFIFSRRESSLFASSVRLDEEASTLKLRSSPSVESRPMSRVVEKYFVTEVKIRD